MEISLVKGLGPTFKQNYLRLIAAGAIEKNALDILEVDWLDFFEICSKDPTFRSNIDDARKVRADRWIDGIAESLDKVYYLEVKNPETNEIKQYERPPSKDEIARDKLHFEKMKFLAQADNPEKYTPGVKLKLPSEFDMADFKLLSIEEAKTAIHNDPFAMAIEAEIVEDKSDTKP